MESHREILCFLRWARREGYGIDERILDLVAPRVPQKEPTVYHIAQLHKILDACRDDVPTEELVVRLLVGSGMRRAEVCGVAVVGPDGLPDVMTDSLRRGRVELRVRWDSGAKGKKSRRMPITPKLASAIKGYEARYRRDSDHPNLLISEHGRPYENAGIKSMMDRLQHRTGFHVHAQAFRHTRRPFSSMTRMGAKAEKGRELAAKARREFAGGCEGRRTRRERPANATPPASA